MASQISRTHGGFGIFRTRLRRSDGANGQRKRQNRRNFPGRKPHRSSLEYANPREKRDNASESKIIRSQAASAKQNASQRDAARRERSGFAVENEERRMPEYLCVI